MTTPHESWRHDLDNYKKLALKASLVLLVILLVLALFLRSSLIGGMLIGSSLANINVFVLGRAFYDVVIKKAGSLALGSPVGFFMILCGVGLFLALFYPAFCLGFALGLTSPLVLGAFIAYRATRPSKIF
jgi:hypothetical protein